MLTEKGWALQSALVAQIVEVLIFFFLSQQERVGGGWGGVGGGGVVGGGDLASFTFCETSSRRIALLDLIKIL